MAMTETEARLRENYPTILMTILSLIVALTYENLIASAKEQPHLWSVSSEGLFVWSQIVFLMVGPLLFWFVHSLYCCSIRAMFAPEDALVPILAGVTFNVLASNLGTQMGAAWLFGVLLLGVQAWWALNQIAKRYDDDPATSGGAVVHRRSATTMLIAGLVAGLAALLLALEVVSTGEAACLFLLMPPIAGIGIVSWYSEWKSAVGLSP